MQHHSTFFTPPDCADTVVHLRVEQIKLSKSSKTTSPSNNAIIRLANSIKRYGILEPLEVKTTFDGVGNTVYELISGAKRLRAAAIAGLEHIPCRILPENDRACAVSGILSRLGEGLSFFEQAAAFRMLMSDFGLTQEEIAQKTGLSQSAVANKLRLLALSKEEQQYIAQAKLTERHARALLRLKSADLRRYAMQSITKEHFNVAQSEQLIEQLLTDATTKENQSDKPIASKIQPQTPPSGIIPRKFALKDLTPLYNSIEKSLSIFRKTGATAICEREEHPDGVRITINIPKA